MTIYFRSTKFWHFYKGYSRFRLYLRAAPSSQSPQDIGSTGAKEIPF
jgi:hypothetical protein